MDLEDYATFMSIDVLEKLDNLLYKHASPRLADIVWPYHKDVANYVHSSLFEVELTSDTTMKLQSPFYSLTRLPVHFREPLLNYLRNSLPLDAAKRLDAIVEELGTACMRIERFFEKHQDVYAHAKKAYSLLCKDPWDYLVAGFAPTYTDTVLLDTLPFEVSDDIVSLWSDVLSDIQ